MKLFIVWFEANVNSVLSIFGVSSRSKSRSWFYRVASLTSPKKDSESTAGLNPQTLRRIKLFSSLLHSVLILNSALRHHVKFTKILLFLLEFYPAIWTNTLSCIMHAILQFAFGVANLICFSISNIDPIFLHDNPLVWNLSGVAHAKK